MSVHENAFQRDGHKMSYKGETSPGATFLQNNVSNFLDQFSPHLRAIGGMYYKHITIVIYDCKKSHAVACTVNMIMIVIDD